MKKTLLTCNNTLTGESDICVFCDIPCMRPWCAYTPKEVKNEDTDDDNATDDDELSGNRQE